MKVRNKKWTEEEFLKVREEVLKSWKTGSSPLLDFEVSIPYLKSLPKKKNMAYVLNEAKSKGRTLVQPRAGVASLDKHIELLQKLEKAGADALPSTIDSYTRLNRYEEAERGLEESNRVGKSMLNGFPAVNHGVEACRKVVESVNVPVQARHGTPDSRLLAEIVHAAGFTSNEGGAISYNLPYAKSVSLEDTIYYWQYCDRLVGYYEDHGVRLNREPFGPLTGTLVPPCITNVIGIIEALLAAEQGVKNITVGYGEGGNFSQDLAAINALQDQTEYYLYKYGYKDVEVTTVFHQWMGGFPQDESEAIGLISMASTVAALSKATKMISKTPHESVGVPTAEANAMGIKASKYICNILKDEPCPVSDRYYDEYYQITKEVDCLLAKVYEVGEGDLAVGVVKAFEYGILDIPFVPSNYNAGKVLPARDNKGAIRILEFGNLGLDEEIKDFHRRKLKIRGQAEGREVSMQMTIDDITAVSRQELIGRPRKDK